MEKISSEYTHITQYLGGSIKFEGNYLSKDTANHLHGGCHTVQVHEPYNELAMVILHFNIASCRTM